jgi:DegV family protein with EDD domain
MRTTVVTDSSACLPTSCPSVDVVPITVLLPHGSGPDSAVDPASVRHALRSGDSVKTRPPSVLDYVASFDRSPGDAVVVLTPSAEVTPMWRNARHAATLERRRVEVVDTRSAAGGHGLVVAAAAAVAEAGGGVADVVAAAESAARRTDLVATLEMLTPLEQGGRLGSEDMAEVRRHEQHLLFRFRHGAVTGLDSPSRARVDAIAAGWQQIGAADAEDAVVFHAAVEDLAADLAHALGITRIIEVSPGLAIHTGTGLLGAACVHAGSGAARSA